MRQFRGSITQPGTSLSTLRAILTNDYARLAYGGGEPSVAVAVP